MSYSLSRPWAASLLSLSLLLPSALSSPVLAQDIDEDKGPVLDEVIVTAQKRAEDAQDVPLSITAISGEEIKEKNIDDLNDLTLYAANTEIVASPIFSFIFMRGIGSGFNKGFEQSVATLVDEVYYGRASYLSNGLLDLSGVEVLRGPQGTLMGKNSVAGVLHIKTGQPQHQWGFDGQVMMGEFNEQRYRAMLTGPIIEDEFAFRVALQHHTRDGDIYNETIDKEVRNIDRQNARLRLLWEPNDAWTITGTINWLQVDEAGPGIELTAATPELLAAFRVFDPDTTADGFDGKNHSDEEGFAFRDAFDLVLHMNWDFWDHSLTSVTAFGGFNEQWHFDVDFTPVPYLIYDIDEDYELRSQEFRLASDEGRLEYVAGVHYLWTHMDVLLQIPLGALEAPGTSLGVLLFPDALDAIASGAVPPGPAIEAERRITRLDQITESYALFGQATYHMFDDALALTLGGRLQYEVKEIDASIVLTNTKQIFPALIAGSEEFDEQREREETNFAPKASIQWFPVDDVMAYATWASGFKSGGFSDAAINREELEFEDEQSTTWEVGVKSRLLDGAATVNLSGFWTDFEDLQLNSFDGQRNIVRNASDARSRGIEFELAWVPLYGLYLGLAGAWIDTEFIDFKDGVCIVTGGANDPSPPCDQSGKPLVYAPEWNATFSIGFDRQLGNAPFRLSLGGSAAYATEMFFSTDHDPVDTNPEATYVRLQGGLIDIDDRWTFSLYAENALDTDLYLITNDTPTLRGGHFGIPRESRRYQAEFRVRY